MTFFTSFSESKKSVVILVKCLLFLCVGIFLFHKIGHIGHDLAPIHALLTQTIDKQDSGPIDVKVLSLGTSHSRAVLAEVLQVPTLQLWTSEQRIADTEFILQFLSNRLENVNLILLPVSVGMTEQSPTVRPKTLVNFILLDAWRTWCLSFPDNMGSYIEGWARPLTRNDKWRNPIGKLYGYDTDKEIVSRKKAKSVQNPFLQNRAELHISKFLQSKLTDTKVDNFKILKRISAISNDLGACLVLYESPVSSHYLNTFINYRSDFADWKTDYEKFIEEENNNEVCVYFLQNLFSLENSADSRLYKDQDHLNQAGSAIFTKTLKEKLSHLFPTSFQ